MSRHSDETPLAWVWSHYRGDQASGAPVVADEVLSPAGTVSADDATPAAGIPDAGAVSAAGSAALQSGGSTGPVLAALILTILGLLWFASAGKKPEASADKGAMPAVSSGSAPEASPPPPSSGPTAVPTSAATPPAHSTAAPQARSEQHETQRRQRRHR